MNDVLEELAKETQFVNVVFIKVNIVLPGSQGNYSICQGNYNCKYSMYASLVYFPTYRTVHPGSEKRCDGCKHMI